MERTCPFTRKVQTLLRASWLLHIRVRKLELTRTKPTECSKREAVVVEIPREIILELIPEHLHVDVVQLCEVAHDEVQ